MRATAATDRSPGRAGWTLRAAAGVAVLSGALLLPAPPAMAACPGADPSCLGDPTGVVQEAEETAGPVVDDLAGTVEETAEPLEPVVGPLVDEAGDLIDGTVDGPGGPGEPGPDPAPPPSGPDRAGRTDGPAGSRRTAPDGPPEVPVPPPVRDAPAPAPDGLSPVRSPLPEDAGPAVLPPRRPGVLEAVRAATARAARRVAFPLALVVVVAAFLAIQGRLDRRDPKLAVAPLRPVELRFE